MDESKKIDRINNCLHSVSLPMQLKDDRESVRERDIERVRERHTDSEREREKVCCVRVNFCLGEKRG